MSLDPRILERFESEYTNSKQREADAQARLDALNEDVAAWQSQVAEEQGIQQAINSTLGQLGVAPLS